MDDEIIAGHRVRPRTIAALVRLADELDEDFRRAPKIAKEWQNLPEDSEFYWNFCERVKGIGAERAKGQITFNVNFQSEDIGRMVRVGSSDRVFLFAFAEKLAKINNERRKTAAFLPEGLKYSSILVNVAPPENHPTWDRPRQILLGDGATANTFIHSLPELLDFNLSVNLLSIYMLFRCDRYIEAVAELRRLKSEGTELNDRVQNFVLYNLACGLSRLAAAQGGAERDKTLDSAVEQIGEWIQNGQNGTWNALGLTTHDSLQRMVWDEDLDAVRKERKDAVREVMPGSYSSWLNDPPERPKKKECVAAGSIIASPTGGVTVESLREGMAILSLEMQPWGNCVPARICGILNSKVSNCIRVNESLVATATQRIYDQIRGWICLGEVVKGTRLLIQDGSYVPVRSLEKLSGQFDVYELSIDDPSHNFIANGFVCHNEK
jgi:hypothetical protein